MLGLNDHELAHRERVSFDVGHDASDPDYVLSRRPASAPPSSVDRDAPVSPSTSPRGSIIPVRGTTDQRAVIGAPQCGQLPSSRENPLPQEEQRTAPTSVASSRRFSSG